MSARAWLREKADSYWRDAAVLADLGTDRVECAGQEPRVPGGLTGEQWAIVYRTIADELRRCAAEAEVGGRP